MPGSDDVTEYRLTQLEHDTRAFGPTVGEVAVLFSKVEGLTKSLDDLREQQDKHHELEGQHHKEQLAAIEAGRVTFWKALGYLTPIIVALIAVAAK